MENVKDSRNVETREVKTKSARGISLKACVAKAARWTLEKANFITTVVKRLALIKHRDFK